MPFKVCLIGYNSIDVLKNIILMIPSSNRECYKYMYLSYQSLGYYFKNGSHWFKRLNIRTNIESFELFMSKCIST